MKGQVAGFLVFSGLAVLACSGCQSLSTADQILCEVRRSWTDKPRIPSVQTSSLGTRTTPRITTIKPPSRPAAPQKTAPPAENHVRQRIDAIWQQYKDFEYDKVVAACNTLLTQPELSTNERAELHILMAACLYIDNDMPRTRDHLIAAIKENRGVKPDPAMLPGEICRAHAVLFQQQK